MFPWGTVAIGGVVVIGGVLIVRAKASASSGSGSSACDAICTAAASQGVPIDACKDGAAYQACKAGSGILDWLSNAFSGPDWAKMDAENIKLNGAIELPLGPLAGRTVQLASRLPAMHGTVLRFANGGVPFKGFPGWEKCKPGTHNMLSDGAALVIDPSTGKWSAMVPANAFSGAIGDPTRGGPFTADHIFHEPALSESSLGGLNRPLDVNEAPFPQSLDGGLQGYYAGGKPFTCPAGTTPQWNLRDQRSISGPPPCVGPDGTGGWSSSGPQVGVSATSGNESGQVGNLTNWCVNGKYVGPPGYYYDTTAKAFRRVLAGQTPPANPCAGIPTVQVSTSGKGGYADVSALIGE